MVKQSSLGKIGGFFAGTFLSTLTLFSGGCNNLDPYHEVFRNNDKKNMAPLAEIFEINYDDYDKERDFKIINDRAYLEKTPIPNPVLEKIVEVPQTIRYRIPALGDATYIEDANDIILKYKSRLPAPDLQKLITENSGDWLKDIKINSHENTLVFTGNKQNFGDFGNLTDLINEFDLPAKQVRIKLSIVEHFNDNTYDRDLAIEALRRGINIATLNLPSLADPTTELTTGLNINPAYGINSRGYSLHSAIQFLNSYGKTRTLSSEDLLTDNGKTVEFKNVSSIPYPEAIVAGNAVVDAIKYRDTGTKIKVTPYANEQGFITIKLDDAESGEQTGFIGTLQRPTFRTANLKSEFTVRNGLAYIIDTSLFTRYKQVERGIPLIDQLPLLGDLFSSKSIEHSQSQLIFFLEAREVGREDLIGIDVGDIDLD